MSEMEQALAASSMLLAIVAIIFGAWTGDLSKVRSTEFALQEANREGQRRLYREAIKAKALPLSIGAWLSAAVFFPRSCLIVASVVTCGKGCGYDDVGVAFVLTELFVIAAAVSVTMQLVDLATTLKQSHVKH